MTDKPSTSQWVLLADIPVDKGLTDLPVVGAEIPRGTAGLEGIQLQLCSSATGVNGKDAQEINALIEKFAPGPGAKALLLPKNGLSGRGGIGATVRLLGRSHALNAPLDGKRTAVEPWQPDGAGPGTAGLEPAPTAGARWRNVDASLGPLRLRRIGLAAARGRAWLLVDGGVSLSVVSLQSLGLGVGVSLDGRYSAVGCLDGLGLDFSAGPVSLSGAFLRLPPPKEYELKVGGLVTATITGVGTKLPHLSIAAAGFYAQKKDRSVALFVYGELGGLRVGPPPFQVTGLMGGFGYNMRVDRPALSEVSSFPLVAGLDRKDSDKPRDPAAVLADLAKVVHPAPGRICLAAGLTFTCFGLVDARALLLLQAGDQFVLSLLGTATAQFPKGAGRTVYARATLALKAEYAARRGELSLEGELDRSSFIISPECKPKGGFAYCTWLAPSPHAGDFVVSLGGYHPGYAKRAHYPEVQRIGYQWGVSSSLSVRGECYAALTPSAFMVGGLWQADFHAGRVKAWFRARVNAVIQWQPFFFDLSVGVTVQVEADLWLKTLRLKLEVDLFVWGPPTGGVAELRLPAGVGTVRMRFGEDRPGRPDWLKWPQFTDTVLGAKPLEVRAVTGLLPAPGAAASQSGGPEGKAVWTASTEGFTFATSSKVPISKVHRGGTPATDITTDGVADDRRLTRDPVSIRPMNLRGRQSEHTVTVRRHTGGGGTETENLAAWDITAVTGSVPASLWDKPLDKPDTKPPVPDGRTEELLSDRLLGVRVVVPGPKLRGTSLGPVAEQDLLSKEIAGPVRAPTAGPQWNSPVRGSRADLATELATPSALKAREALVTALAHEGMTPPGTGSPPRPGKLDGYAGRLWSYLQDDPALVNGAR
ncbi:hypothetical protein FGW37_31025 [Streptomyces rectiverticillatus]|uniref:DUF6603 domain-containing protein n=1 Tax=Streptomyces rectiverticillatus TaxID=173860 RepID=UPI0015C3F657|nr:DUF6603 domain-containing protein [Streptomyces rectiverticillatus]QLE75429.1 hypothetical protein FGW37_31025 [Streptomyces rectiverticillatus]